MRYTAKMMRGKLQAMIRRMGENQEEFVRTPGRDFTRPRRLTFETVITLLLTMSEKSIGKELMGYFKIEEKTPSAAAFVQQRQKILPQALYTLFQRFTAWLHPGKAFRGYRLLAVDGTSLKSVSYPEDTGSYRPGTERQHGWNMHHINALFDLENQIYTDLIVQKEHDKNESKALCAMVDRSPVSGKTIVLADRNYESWNNLAHLEKKSWKYLIRLREKGRTTAYGVKLPDLPEFDLPVQLTLGRLTKRQLEQRGCSVPEHYYPLPPGVTFDYLEPGNTDFYTLSFRIVRLKLSDKSTEMLLTNLDQDDFPSAALKSLYARRWGIETSFRSLKYTVGLIHLHAKKPDLILQEIFASFLIFNFMQTAAAAVDTSQGVSKYQRHVNFSDTVFACCLFLRDPLADPLPLLHRKLISIRPGRFCRRPMIAGTRISSNYVSAR